MATTNHGRTARAVADREQGAVLATVDVAAPPERAFRALTSDEVERWWGSADTYRMTGWAADVRPGGRWRVGVRGTDGVVRPASGEFREVDAPRRVVQTRVYEWEHPTLGWHETTVTYLFEPTATGTRVTVRHEGFAGRGEAADEHAFGWERALSWLERYLESNDAAA